MNEKEKLLRRLSAAQFAMWETHIFLDTHPNDEAALAALKKYTDRYTGFLKEYEEKYGPIVGNAVNGGTEYSWVRDPWPWEGADN